MSRMTPEILDSVNKFYEEVGVLIGDKHVQLKYIIGKKFLRIEGVPCTPKMSHFNYESAGTPLFFVDMESGDIYKGTKKFNRSKNIFGNIITGYVIESNDILESGYDEFRNRIWTS